MQRSKLKDRLSINSFFCKGTWSQTNISAFKESYSFELGVVDNLYADVILSLDFLNDASLHCFCNWRSS